MDVFADLERRERQDRPVRIGVVGAGYFGSGIVRRSLKIVGLRPSIVANRTLDKAIDALQKAGLTSDNICVTDDPDVAGQAIVQGRSVATSVLSLPAAYRRLTWLWKQLATSWWARRSR